MKYCPYCGAELLGGTASFCCECGKSIKGRKTKAKSEKKPPAEKRKKSNIIETEDVTPKSENNEEITTEENDGYDGYYDDILPVDESIERQGIDKTVVKNLIIIIVGVIVAISICVAAMYLM